MANELKTALNNYKKNMDEAEYMLVNLDIEKVIKEKLSGEYY